MALKATTIRMQPKLKKELDNLKLIKQEPYENVIKRLIEYFKENMDLNKETKKLLLKRIKNVEEGKVISTRELYQKFLENKKGE